MTSKSPESGGTDRPTFRLGALGPARLVGPDGEVVLSVLKQPKRMALLVYLALGPEGGRTRTEVVDRFWDDRSEVDARHALSQALYYLRRSLGKAAIRTEGEVLDADPDVVDVDVRRFRERLRKGALEDAVALYEGDFLQGFPAVEMAGVDRWIDQEREILRREALHAVERLSRDAEARGDPEAAVRWAERGHEIAPLHEAPLRRLLAALISASETVRAHEVFERFERRLREELEMEPSPETVALLDTPPPARAPDSVPAQPGPEATPSPSSDPASSAAARTTASSAETTAPSNPTPTGSTASRTAAIRTAAAAAPSGVPPPRPIEGPTRRSVLGRYALLAGGVFLVVALGFELLVRAGADVGLSIRGEAAVVERRVGVFPFSYGGQESLTYLGPGIAELLSMSLQSLDQVSILDPRVLASGGNVAGDASVEEAAARARALGAGHFVVGSVVEAGGRIQVTARMYRTDGTPVASVSGRADEDEELFDLVDALARRLVAQEDFPVGASSLERAAALTSESLSALRRFLEGERYFRQGRYPEAVDAFDHAIREDSAFALAWYRGAVGTIWGSGADFVVAREKVQQALHYTDRLSPLEVELLHALDAFLRGRFMEAEQRYEGILQLQPENLEAWFQLAETRFHLGALHGKGVEKSKEAWERVLELDPDHHAALVHLAAIEAVRGSSRLDSVEARINPDSVAMRRPQVRALRVFSSGDEGDVDAFLEELTRHSPRTALATAGYAARYLARPGVGIRIAEELTTELHTPDVRAEAYRLIAHFALAQGRRGAAFEAIEAARALDPEGTEVDRLLLATIPTLQIALGGGAANSASEGADGERARFDMGMRMEIGSSIGEPVQFDGTVPSGIHLYAQRLAYHRVGGEDGALLSAARQLEAVEDEAEASLLRPLAEGLLAERHLAQLDSAGAFSDLERALAGAERWYEHLRESYRHALVRERVLLAELAIAEGRDDRALALLRPIGESSVAELPYLGPKQVRIGEILERAGETGGAIQAYRRALELWSDADPEMEPVMVELRRRIQGLEG